MKPNQRIKVKLGKLPKPSKTATSLSKTLTHSEQIKDVVVEYAEELSSVNIALEQEFADQEQPAGVEKALEISGEIEIKVQDAAEQLAAVIIHPNKMRCWLVKLMVCLMYLMPAPEN